MTRSTSICLGVAALALSLVSGCATPRLEGMLQEIPVKTSPLQLGGSEWRVTDQAILITDASGTMYMNDTFLQAKTATQSFVGAMPARDVRAKRPNQYNASLVGFGGNERHVVPLAPFDRAALGRGATSLELLGASTGGTTPFSDVFVELQKRIAPRGGPAAIVVFSDGLPDDPALATWAAYRIVASHPSGVCIHTVQTGSDPAGTQFLQGISRLTGCGTHRSASTLTDSAAFGRFAHQVFVDNEPTRAPSACEGRIVLRGVEFEFDKAVLRPESEVVLNVAADQLRECPNIRVAIDGHTDSLGSEAYNEGLSKRRADSVLRYFVGRGLQRARFTARGFGESNPVASNDTDAGRARNRRVELRPQQ